MKADTLTGFLITDPDFRSFLEISVYLTGFTKIELISTGMLETYFFTIMKEQDQDNARLFFKKAAQIVQLKKLVAIEKAITAELMPALGAEEIKYKDQPYEGLARRIILLWYEATWTPVGDGQSGSYIVSSEAYTRGLVWQAAETHPPGARQPGYYSWSKPPG